jgi:hypothetical protein
MPPLYVEATDEAFFEYSSFESVSPEVPVLISAPASKLAR